jgi:phytoene dehydrogenase-like protein
MTVIVLGAGVVGAASAWYLAQAGHEVEVVERRVAGATCRSRPLSWPLAVQSVEVDLVLKTRNHEHAREIVAALKALGFEATAYPVNE